MTLTNDIDISRGNSIVLASETNMPSLKDFSAHVCWLDHQALIPGKTYLLQHGIHVTKAKITQIMERLDVTQQTSSLIIVLRLAILLRRNRDENELPNLDISFSKKKIHLNFPLLWLDQAPLTRADLNQEAEYLKAASFSLVFS